ncbi:hypothetical protein ACFPME_05715 [Rhodanobacter umsongensis]|uniref:DUF4234 domain-containing protein n=1 Tax=Rhodanobacter umsongensis TaxID=633153 RepID=A0ABW0JJZ3_9GAMM
MHNPYQAPATPLEELEQPGELVFFPVSVVKLLVLSLCTFGLYEIYWFYKNWQLVKRRENSNIIPVMRSLFGVLFCYSLFEKVSDQAKNAGTGSIAAGLLAAGWIVLTILWRLPDPYWLVTFLAVLFMLPVQQAINAINSQAAPGHDPNRTFSGWNIAAVIIGGLFFVLALVGIFLPAEQA